MSSDRIRPGDAARRRGDGGTQQHNDDVAADEWVNTDASENESGDEADVPFAIPLVESNPGAADIGAVYGAMGGTSGLQTNDEPLRPEEFVNDEVAEEVLGKEQFEAAKRHQALNDDGLTEQANFDGTGETTVDLHADDGRGAKHERFWHKLYYGRTRIDFVRRKRTWFTLSLIVILAGVISLGIRGLDLGIEFAGGSAWTVKTSIVSPQQARNAIAPLGYGGATITVLGDNAANHTLEVESKIGNGSSSKLQSSPQVAQVTSALARLAHVNPEKVGVETVGPSWGSSVTNKAIQALVVFFILVSLYISIFFEWRMALGAVIAVGHDVMVVVGIYSLTGLEVTPDTVVAILTILGYSLYDTIVVFDRVRDNLKGAAGSGKITISDVVNLSMNQTLARSINTSLVAILPIFSVLILGADVLGAQTLQYFGWALMIGLLSGAYSSIFIAAPIVALLKEREPRYRIIREKLAARGMERQLYSAASIAAGVLGSDISGAPIKRRSVAGSAVAGQRDAGEARNSGMGQAHGGGSTSTRKTASRPAAKTGSKPSPSTSERRPPARNRRKGRQR